MALGPTARWPRSSSPAANPGNIAAESVAEIDRGLMQGQLCGSCPELKGVAPAATAMAKVATERDVGRERVATTRHALGQRTTSVALDAAPIRGLEPEQVQDLLHRDLRTKSLEVDAWHGSSSLGDGPLSGRGPFRSLSLYGERERPPESIL
jgi:hypothetical protein